MHHDRARRVITGIQAGRGFGERAVTMALAAEASELPGGSDELAQRLLDRALAMGADAASESTPELEAADGDEAGLCRTLLPLVLAQPSAFGLQLATVDALRSLWPHVASHERAGLRRRFAASVNLRQAPPESLLTRPTLEAWQRDLPTSSPERNGVAGLGGLLDQMEARDAYRLLANCLGVDFQSPTLFGALGSLAVRVLLTLRDQQGWGTWCVLGSQAGARLTLAGPEPLASAIIQLAHQIWWCRRVAGFTPLRVCLDASAPPLIDAVHSGDCSAAQRSARLASTQPARFWSACATLLADTIGFSDARFARAVAVSSAIGRRALGGLSPDDAAALATVFSELVWQHHQRTSVAE